MRKSRLFFVAHFNMCACGVVFICYHALDKKKIWISRYSYLVDTGHVLVEIQTDSKILVPSVDVVAFHQFLCEFGGVFTVLETVPTQVRQRRTQSHGER